MKTVTLQANQHWEEDHSRDGMDHCLSPTWWRAFSFASAVRTKRPTATNLLLLLWKIASG
jgi:hypothetical protein